jgi:hypothetical protein
MNTAQNHGFGIWQLLSNATIQSVLGVLILMIVCTLALYMLSKLRDSTTQDAPMEDVLRKNFEEMRSEGYINEAEFRNIASLLEENPRRSVRQSATTDFKTDASNADEK